jgi:hypothetical protein
MGGVVKKVLPVIAALVAVGLIAGLAGLMWKVEKRDSEDLSVAIRAENARKTALARSLLPLLNHLGSLRYTLDGMEPGTDAYRETEREIVEAQNLLASQLPALSTGRDQEGNAVLVPLDEAWRILNDMASWDKG